jgi:hypothetical protein
MKTVLIYILVLALLPLFASADYDPQESILEKVEVTNIRIPVRVFHKGKPVQGLKKEDFKLFVNGKEREIRAFYETSKKITMADAAAGAKNTNPRLFLLMFNISDPDIKIKEAVDPFFKNILRPGDRLMVFTNGYVLNDRLVSDPETERQKIEFILQAEKAKARWNETQIKINIETLYKEYIEIIQSSQGEMIQFARRYFIRNYIKYLDSFRADLLEMNVSQYIELASYLEKQDTDKWVLNFFQIPHFPRVKQLTDLDEDLSKSTYYFDMVEAVNTPADMDEKSISKFFINTGATFHTVLMGSRDKILTNENFEYASVPVSSEDILKRATKLTGGAITRSNKTGKFFSKLSAGEDVYYNLFYASDSSAKHKKEKIKITIPNAKYKVFYDNQKKKNYFQSIVKKVKKQSPQIVLGAVNLEKGTLNFMVENFKMAVTDREKYGSVSVRISVFDEDNSKFVFDRKKDTRAVNEKIDFRITMGDLKPGNYKIFVEVTDLFTKKNDLGMKEVSI